MMVRTNNGKWVWQYSCVVVGYVNDRVSIVDSQTLCIVLGWGIKRKKTT